MNRWRQCAREVSQATATKGCEFMAVTIAAQVTVMVQVSRAIETTSGTRSIVCAQRPQPLSADLGVASM